MLWESRRLKLLDGGPVWQVQTRIRDLTVSSLLGPKRASVIIKNRLSGFVDVRNVLIVKRHCSETMDKRRHFFIALTDLRAALPVDVKRSPARVDDRE